MMNRHSSSLSVRPFISAGLFCALAALGVWMRTIPHPAMATPIAASALFIAYVSGRSWVGLLLAPLTMFLGDRVLGAYDGRMMACVYMAAAFPALLRVVLAHKLTVSRLVGCSLLSSTVFFLVTNFAVWAFGAPESTYPFTAAGLAACYIKGLPFFANGAFGDLAWIGVFFGLSFVGQSLLRKHSGGAPVDGWRTATVSEVK